MEVAAVLYFLSIDVKLHFYSLAAFAKKICGCPEGRSSFGSGFPIGASSTPVGTRLSSESLVCYTFVEQMAAGIVARPGKCGYSCGVLAGKVAPYGAA